MISIKFLDKNKNSLTVITSFFDVRINNKLSDTCTAQFTIPYNSETISKLKENVRKVWNIVEIRANIDWWRQIFVWVIRQTTITWQYVVFDCIDLISYYRQYSWKKFWFWSLHRVYYSEWYNERKEPCPFIDNNKNIIHCDTNGNPNYIINEWKANAQSIKLYKYFEYLFDIYWITLFELWTIWENYLTTNILNKSYTFFDMLDYLKQYKDIYYRANWYKLDIIWTFDEIQPWLWKYDYTDVIWSDVIDFKRKESLDSLLQNDKTDNYPSIELEDKEWYKYKVWQKKAIQIHTQLDWWNTWYIWYITEINIKAEATKVIGTIKVDEKPRKRTDESLRWVLEKLHKRVINI